MKVKRAALVKKLRAGLQLAGLRARARVHLPWAVAHALALFATPDRGSSPAPALAPAEGDAALSGRPMTVDFRGRGLAAWQWGPAGGPTVVLTHGWNGHAGHMSAFVPALLTAGFRVVSFDHPAHGRSGGTRTNMLEFRDALLAVVAAVGPVTAVLGHSLGATTTILAFDRGLDAGMISPAAKVILIAPPLDPPDYARTFGRAKGWSEHLISALIEHLRAFVRADLGSADAISVARTQSRAALLIHDRDDRAVPFEQGLAVAAAWPGCQLFVTSGLGHRRILSDPAVLAEVVGFIAQATV